MVDRLDKCIGENRSDRQFGFRTGLGVKDAWHFVQSKVRTSTCRYVLGLFIDFKCAFDYLSWPRVLHRLNEVGCKDLALWQSYFSERRACVVGSTASIGTVWWNVERGCPQGSVCGPYIWNLMMDTLLRQIEGQSECCAYADDFLVLIEGKSRLERGKRGNACCLCLRGQCWCGSFY